MYVTIEGFGMSKNYYSLDGHGRSRKRKKVLQWKRSSKNPME